MQILLNNFSTQNKLENLLKFTRMIVLDLYFLQPYQQVIVNFMSKWLYQPYEQVFTNLMNKWLPTLPTSDSQPYQQVIIYLIIKWLPNYLCVIFEMITEVAFFTFACISARKYMQCMYFNCMYFCIFICTFWMKISRLYYFLHR